MVSIMLSKAFTAVLTMDLPVLFTYIGWTSEYNGSEPVIGGHRYLKTHPRDNSEARAFEKDTDGFFRCGAGRGQAPKPVHIVFVAFDPEAQVKKIVGVYANSVVEDFGTWSQARTRHAVLIPVDRRPKLSVEWPEGQGVRRWAGRAQGQSHSNLLRAFRRLKSDLATILNRLPSRRLPLDQTYSGMEAREGEQYARLVIHRSREAKLRNAKIDLALSSNGGRLICEVPHCGFDFLKRYGKLGYGYAQVHHRTPLRDTGNDRKKTTLADLAIVCANCHAMIHRNGMCRDLTHLIPGEPRNRTWKD